MAELLKAGVSKSEIGILSRTNRTTEAVERVLKERNIHIAMTTPAVENPYVREAVMPLLRLLLDNRDNAAFMDVALLSCSIESASLEELQRRMEAEKRCSLYDAALSIPPFHRPKGVGDFLNKLKELEHPFPSEEADQLVDWVEGWLIKVQALRPNSGPNCAPTAPHWHHYICRLTSYSRHTYVRCSSRSCCARDAFRWKQRRGCWPS